MPLQATSGAASYDAFGGGVPVVPNYIEEVFSTYLYTGNGSTQTITNNIDLSGQGGLVWIKSRTAYNHNLFDTTRGVNNRLFSNTTAAQTTTANSLTAFNTNGFSLGGIGGINDSSDSLVSWTFREQPKFFDVVTWTGNDSGDRAISHALTSTPGCILLKRLDGGADDWAVYHRSLGTSQRLYLNTNDAATGATAVTAVSSSTFTVNSANSWNFSGLTYVAYLFAHDAGGFGLTGTDNVISCGGFTTDGSGNATVNLGYEPQWVLIKPTNEVNSWVIVDTMRGYSLGAGDTGADARLRPNTSDAESNTSNVGYPTSTGFYVAGSGSINHIYIAIRRGPMKVPTSGTSVFSPVARTGTGSQTNVGGLSFSPDLLLVKNRGNTQLNWAFDKLRGGNQPLSSNSTDDEATNISNYFGGSTVFTPNNTGFGISNAAQVNTTSGSYANWLFGRAPSFFDEVCYTGNGTTLTVNHNLGVAPQLMIVKARSIASQNWFTYSETLGNNYALRLDQNYGIDVLGTFPYWNNTTPTSTNFVVNNSGNPQVTNGSGVTYVSYLFATCAGVSKVGSYTGTGATQTISCGFTGGARFVLIKRTDSTGDWYVWDTARGIVSGNDPYLLMNSTAAEVTGTDYVDTYSAGFEISSTAPAAINANGGSFIFLAIA